MSRKKIPTTPGTAVSSHRLVRCSATSNLAGSAATLKGYPQSGNVDYFLGNGMAQPPCPDIAYTG